jgi:hypothetical protein
MQSPFLPRFTCQTGQTEWGPRDESSFGKNLNGLNHREGIQKSY